MLIKFDAQINAFSSEKPFLKVTNIAIKNSKRDTVTIKVRNFQDSISICYFTLSGNNNDLNNYPLDERYPV